MSILRNISILKLSLLLFLVAGLVEKSIAQPLSTTADQGLATPVILTSPLIGYQYDKLDYGMTTSIERTLNGTIWTSWIGGGDNEDAFLLLNRSTDNGDTWSEPLVVIDPHSIADSIKKRTLVATLWLDPLGRLWLFFDQGLTYFDGRSGVWYSICEKPDENYSVWTKPQRIWHGCTLNKPTVLANGVWILPVSLWDRTKIKSPLFKNAYTELDSFRMAHVFISTDQGKSWQRQGGVAFPQPQFDEHHVIARKDGSLWMTARTEDGIWESVSADEGKTWSVPLKYMEHIGSRHFITRTQAGNLILIKHGGINERTRTRSKLTAYLSADDGTTWQGGLLIDERRGVSYPDGFGTKDGFIYISYDRNRDTDGEILLARFREEDILNKNFLSQGSFNKRIISKPRGLDKVPPAYLQKTHSIK